MSRKSKDGLESFRPPKPPKKKPSDPRLPKGTDDLPADWAAFRMIDRATDGFMVLFRDPSPAVRKKAEGDIMRLIRHAVKIRNAALIKSLHIGFRMAFNTIKGCSVDDSMEYLRKEMDAHGLNESPPDGLKSWPPTLKELKRFIDHHGGHRYPETMIATVAKAKGVPVRRERKRKNVLRSVTGMVS
jgi:hypothetical protein